MNDLRFIMLYKYIDRLYYETENDLIIIKNRMIARDCTSVDYADLALAYARHENTLRICRDIISILQKWKP